VWRGILFSKEEMMDMVDAHYSTTMDRKDEDSTEIYSLIDDMNSVVGWKPDSSSCIPRFHRIVPCCGEDKHVLFGLPLAEYMRAPFSWVHVAAGDVQAMKEIHEKSLQGPKVREAGFRHCGKVINDKDRRDSGELKHNDNDEKVKHNMEVDDKNVKSGDRCGEYYCCDSCLAQTINGAYPIDQMASSPIECTTYCFTCNLDRCSPQQHISCLNTNHMLISVRDLVDNVIGNSLEELETNRKDIKNYYSLDDCLSCT